jgi:hypothetical protein
MRFFRRGLGIGEAGQATTEYILLLFMLVTLMASLARTTIRPALERLSGSMEALISRQFTRGLHNYRAR